MMTVEPRIYTDPACEASWAAEPSLRRLLWEFHGELSTRRSTGNLAFTGEDGECHEIRGAQPFEVYREAASGLKPVPVLTGTLWALP